MKVLLPPDHKKRNLRRGERHCSPLDDENMRRILHLVCVAKSWNRFSFIDKSKDQDGVDKVDYRSDEERLFFEPRCRKEESTCGYLKGNKGSIINAQKVDELRFQSRLKGYCGYYAHGFSDAVQLTCVTDPQWWDWATTKAWSLEGYSNPVKRNGGFETACCVPHDMGIAGVELIYHPDPIKTPWKGDDSCWFEDWQHNTTPSTYLSF